MEMARDEVRVMTVHGAKGLEAPIVILADTTTPPQGLHPPRAAAAAARRRTGRRRWSGPTAKANDVGPMGAAREAALGEARDEYRRLLYVAMTRAIERLVVCGVDGVNKRPEGCWYDLARDALEAQCSASRPTTARARCCASVRCPSGAREATEEKAHELALLRLAERCRGGRRRRADRPSGRR